MTGGVSLRHRGEHVLFVLARSAVRALPHALARPTGRRLGAIAWALDGRHRSIVDANLRLAYPEWAPAERRRLSKQCFQHFGAMVFDTASLGRFDAVELCRRIVVDGWEHVDEAREGGHGCLCFSAHLGNWEVASHPLAYYRGPFHAIARPFNNPLVYAHLARERERFGQRLIAKSGAARELFRVLRHGGMAGVVMDQRVRPSQGIVIDLFGAAALATPLPAAVTLRTGASALPVFARPEPGGRYRVEIRPPLAPEPGADARDEAAVLATTQRLMKVIEDAIREKPEQWLWMHRRWRLD